MLLLALCTPRVRRLLYDCWRWLLAAPDEAAGVLPSRRCTVATAHC